MTFIQEWDPEATTVEWQARGRERLNVVIRRFNQWVRDAASNEADPKEQQRIDIVIEEALQTWATRDGGSNWRVELNHMRTLLRASRGVGAAEDHGQTDRG